MAEHLELVLTKTLAGEVTTRAVDIPDDYVFVLEQGAEMILQYPRRNMEGSLYTPKVMSWIFLYKVQDLILPGQRGQDFTWISLAQAARIS